MSSNKSGSMRVLTFVLIVLLLLAIFGGVIGIGYAYGRFGNISEEERQDELPADEEENTVITESESNGVSLLMTKIAEEDYEEYGISTLASTAYTLTASTTDGDITDYELDWSIAFKDSSSSWASGKTVTDYCTIAPTKEGGNVATITNLKAFGEQIIVTVSSRANPSVSASCTVDYYKRLTNVGVEVGMKDNDSYNATYGLTYTLLNLSDTSSVASLKYSASSYESIDTASSFYVTPKNYVYGDGTITETYSVSSYYMCLDDEVAYELGYGFSTSEIYHNEDIWYLSSVFEDIVGSKYTLSQLYNALQPYHNSGATTLEFHMTLKGASSGISTEFVYYIDVDYSALALSIISLDKSSIVI